MSISLLTGICFATGIMVVMLLWDVYVASIVEEETWVDQPSDVTIRNHSMKPNSARFTIVGEIQNDSSHDWKTVWLDADIFADSALVNSCEDTFRHIPARSATPFELQCYDIAGMNLPDNIRYEVRVRTGLR